MMAMAAAGAGGEEEGKPPENQEGLHVLNAAGEVIQSGGMSGHGDGTIMEYTMTYQQEPAKILFRWHAEKAERKISVAVKGLPVP